MGYYIDLSLISLEDYKNKLATAYLPPSRKILREKREERFAYFSRLGIKNVKELFTLLKNKEKFKELHNVEVLSGDYLKILLRELNSTLPKPNRFRDFKALSSAVIENLEKIGIKNTRNLYDHILTPESRKELCKKTGIDKKTILKLCVLADLSRIKWVGATTAQMLYDLDLNSVEKVAASNPEKLHERINKLNKEQNIYKGSISLNDIRILVAAAGDLSFEIRF